MESNSTAFLIKIKLRHSLGRPSRSDFVQSEFALVKYIYTNLHLPVKIIAKDKGRGSIQINGLPEYLMKKQFRTLKAFADEFSVEYDRKTKRLINFKLFIIMDTDDCDEITRSKYISKELFDGHPLKDYIVPLYNDTNLEDVMIKSGIMVKRIPDAQKGSYYTKIFPINTKPLSIDTVNQVRIFAKKIDGVKETNMLAFVEYCFQQMPGEELWG
ncbi:hypothetical protein [Agathobacter rectalis]|uniref:hypothetical protein n=2 Tax=Agathobacter rectalis TaxID=39491 RepID=UPI00321A8615